MDSTEELKTEVLKVRRKLARLRDEVARNTRILKQSQQRELDLLQAHDLTALFRCMLFGLADSYQLETITVLLCDPDHDLRHLLLAAGTETATLPGLHFVDSLSGLPPPYLALRKPWLGPFRSRDHRHVMPDTPRLGSVALLPLIRSDTLLGSLNFGSVDATRFTARHATDFFSHLAIIASFALENAVNRARLFRSGFTDVLTGWHNRRYLEVRLQEELARARRDRSELVCLMLDLDHFKDINDTHGHAAGDAVLRELAQRVESQVRASDVAARYGGEEFVILLPHTDVASGMLLAERIRRAVSRQPVVFEGDGQATVTTSIGISALLPGDGGDLETLGRDLLARADAALYRAKAGGRNRVEVAEPTETPAAG